MLPFCAVNTICPVYVPTARVGLVVTIAVSVCGVEQRTQPPKHTFFTESQLPPVAVDTLAVKLKLAPVLAAVKVWGSGSAPPKNCVKLMPFTGRKTLSPTATLTGTVTLLPAERNTSSPVNVPAIRPAFGRLGTDIPT